MSARRAGDARGSARARRARKQWLLDTFGDGLTAPCGFCGKLLTLDELTVDRYPIPGCAGGRYVKGNIRPACWRCNCTAPNPCAGNQ